MCVCVSKSGCCCAAVTGQRTMEAEVCVVNGNRNLLVLEVTNRSTVAAVTIAKINSSTRTRAFEVFDIFLSTTVFSCGG